MAATERTPQYVKDERQHLLDRWRQQGLDVDEIAGRFRAATRLGALTANRWPNDLTQLGAASRP